MLTISPTEVIHTISHEITIRDSSNMLPMGINSFNNPYQHILSPSIASYMTRLTDNTSNLMASKEEAFERFTEDLITFLSSDPSPGLDEGHVRGIVEVKMRELRERYWSQMDLLFQDLLSRLQGHAREWGEELHKIMNYSNLHRTLGKAMRKFNSSVKRSGRIAIREANRRLKEERAKFEGELADVFSTLRGVASPDLTIIPPRSKKVARTDMNVHLKFQISWATYRTCSRDFVVAGGKMMDSSCLKNNRFVRDYRSLINGLGKLANRGMTEHDDPDSLEHLVSSISDRFQTITRDFPGDKGEIMSVWAQFLGRVIRQIDGKGNIGKTIYG